MNGTLVRNLEQPFPLFRVEVSHELNLALDSIDLAFLGFAVPAIRRVNFCMAKSHGHTLERPLLRSRVKGYRHRRARTQRCEKQIVRSRSGICSAELDWLVRGQPVGPNNDFLGEPRGVAVHDYICDIHAQTLPLSRPAASRLASCSGRSTDGKKSQEQGKMKSDGNQSSIMGCVVMGLIAALILCAILYPFRQTGKQSLDAWTRAAWMFTNAKDEQTFPPKAELCAAPFCTRADTEPKYVGGNPGHRSATTLPFCPEHTSGLPKTGTRYDDLLRFIYWVLAMVMSWLEATLILGIVCYPLALIVAFLRRDPAGETPWRRALVYSAALGMVIGGAATILVWVMFAWW